MKSPSREPWAIAPSHSSFAVASSSTHLLAHTPRPPTAPQRAAHHKLLSSAVDRRSSDRICIRRGLPSTQGIGPRPLLRTPSEANHTRRTTDITPACNCPRALRSQDSHVGIGVEAPSPTSGQGSTLAHASGPARAQDRPRPSALLAWAQPEMPAWGLEWRPT